MKVFEGAHRENDITFAYNADFFLYASLHHDSEMNGGRANPQNGPPVLTGSPVSSMILLDRPEEAGYFIFSDLSVRHEGRYFLQFSLLEEVKEERDKDLDEHMPDADEITGPSMDRAFVHRTTVKTDVFDVFSAKKFPGLQESTALSRTVAEQGCRVRIRRDVRMRKREKTGKGGKDAAPREDNFVAKPRVEAARRGGSSSSNDAAGPYRPDLQRRRMSGMDYPQPPPQQRPYAAPEPSPSRPPTYAPMPPYPPHAQSIPNSPSYPPPPPGAHFAPHRQPYQPYASDRPSPPRHYGPPPHSLPVLAPQRDHPPYRGPGPVLAPKLEPDPDVQTLPPIRSLNTGMTSPPRRPSLPQHRLPQLLPTPVSGREISPPEASPYPSRSMEPRARELPTTLAPIMGQYGVPRTVPAGPVTPPLSSSKKRSYDEMSPPLPPGDAYRRQKGRRDDEIPRDANYKSEIGRSPPMMQHAPPTMRHPTPMREPPMIRNPAYVPPEHTKPTLPPQEPPREKPEGTWEMSFPQYSRASDCSISVDFPGLHV